ncbi:2-polyprenyl-6-methoxyphenol hydroxylase [Micromonospora echinofusca]|uniref:2-polyprenyl-6-methoxyphenol hydroxylase n=1 Tax=Micromonospora echinofusca TaxID=47858 RepID=A0A1C5GC66_MICEH|nr:FAD-dependent monooxygenase [Micromonospora echinofusca]SCG17380.1 2-polyprenyl-6-methoxyphenol hydroxylase [Micromonospora echinofusca]
MATGSAVVIGASMGGLLTARALTEAYERVTLVDRDLLPERADSRRGVPQGRQLHVLLTRGRQAFEELLPGISAELAARGVPTVDLHEQVHWYNNGHRMRRAPSPLFALGVSRPLLEQVVRERVAALPGVRIVSDCEVAGLTTTVDRRRVTGVRLHPRDGEPTTVAADLVVDAGGRGTRSPVWLAELGYRPAPEERVKVGVTYLTRTYRREPHHLEGLLGALTNAVPGRPRGGIVAVQEQGRFAVALSGMLGEEPPADDEGMTAFAETLAAPQIAELLRTAQPEGPPATMKFPASVRRRYERLRRFPAGYLVVADAVCSFNPVYGQGMTVAALEALLLRRLLRRSPDRLARRFFRGAARLIDGPWSIAVGTDLRFPEVPGRRSPRVRLVNAYVGRLHAAATRDPALGAAFLRVVNLVDPPTRLLSPPVLLRVLRGAPASAR